MPGVFTTDAILAGVAAWLVACAGGHAGRGCLEAALAWAWSFVALVAGAGVALGISGGFGPPGFLVLHALALAALLFARWRLLAADLDALKRACRQGRQFFSVPGPERFIGLCLVLALAALAMISVFAEPATLDALTYHMPRIGHWLQDGRIRVLGAGDERLNFVAVLPDVVMAWVLGCTREGFRSADLAQSMGGIIAVGATVGLARLSGLGRNASLMAGVLLLGMANVAVQFTSAQTDLFTAGVFAAAFYLWLAALKRGESSALGALGAGLALGAKGTLFYLAPGALIWVAWLAWCHRLPWDRWRRTLAAAAVGVGLFAFPGFARNWQAYGSALGPDEWVGRLHQGMGSASGELHKLYWNLKSAVAQSLDPQSQPLGLRGFSRAAGLAVARGLPANDGYTMGGLDRRATLEKILRRADPDVDVTSFGTLTLLVFAAATLVSLTRWRDVNARLALVWSAGVLTFIVFFYSMQQWHPFGFRYFVLVAPWVAVVSAWGIEQLGGRWRLAVWAMAAAAAADVAWHVTTRTHQAGWQTVAKPEGYLGYYAARGWREWSAGLDHSDEPFVLALPEERPISAFYRQWPPRAVAFKNDPESGAATAQDFLRGTRGWVVVPAARFLGREGRVASSVWLFDGDESSPYSLAAFRALDKGEEPQPICYRHRRTAGSGSVTFELLVKTVGGEGARLALANPGSSARRYAWATPLARAGGVLGAGSKVVITVPMPACKVAEVRVTIDSDQGMETGAGSPTLELLR